MKFLPLIWAGMWRKKLRTVLTLLSIVTAFMLFGLLQGVSESFKALGSSQHLDRLVVMARENEVPLPVSYGREIAAVPGVTAVSLLTGVQGYYQEPKNFTQAMAVEIDNFASIFTELKLSPEQIAGLKANRAGALVGAGIAGRHNWKAGDKVTIIAPGGQEWPFDVLDVIDSGESKSIFTFGDRLIVNYEYVNEMRAKTNPTRKDLVGLFFVQLASPSLTTQVADAIDTMYANAPSSTETSTEKDMAENILKQVGNISLFVNAIMGAVFFTLLFLTGVTMRQAVSERIGELAVLKTLGFTDTGTFSLVVAEAMMLCLFGAAVGLFIAWLAYPMLPGPNSRTPLPSIVIGIGIVAAVVVALASSLLPAWRAKTLSIVDALAER